MVKIFAKFNTTHPALFNNFKTYKTCFSNLIILFNRGNGGIN